MLAGPGLVFGTVDFETWEWVGNATSPPSGTWRRLATLTRPSQRLVNNTWPRLDGAGVEVSFGRWLSQVPCSIPSRNALLPSYAGALSGGYAREGKRYVVAGANLSTHCAKIPASVRPACCAATWPPAKQNSAGMLWMR